MIGSLVVLATLGYLAVQVRHSRNLLEENRVRLRAHLSGICFHQENDLYEHELGLLDS